MSASRAQERVLQLLRLEGSPLTTEQVASGAGIDTRTARYHLRRLEAAGLVTHEGGEQIAKQDFEFHTPADRLRYGRTPARWSLAGEEGEW